MTQKLILALLICCALLESNVCIAQTPYRTLADRQQSASHRIIPKQSGDLNPMNLRNFLTPEMLELQREYVRLNLIQQENLEVRKQDRAQRRKESLRRRAIARGEEVDAPAEEERMPEDDPFYVSPSSQLLTPDYETPPGDLPSQESTAQNSTNPNLPNQIRLNQVSPGQVRSTPNRTSRGPQQILTPSPMGEDLSRVDPSLRNLVRDLWQRSPSQAAQDINQGISDTTKQLNENLPQDLVSEPSELPPVSLGDQGTVTQMMDTVKNLMRETQIRQQELIRKAQAANKAWPLENVPPEDWIQKVQPFINTELIEQLRDVSAAAKTAVDNGKPADSIFEDTNGESDGENGLLGSVMKQLDSKSADWIRSRGKKKGKSSALWKRLKTASGGAMSELNEKLTENSKQLSREGQKLTDRIGAVLGGPAGSNPSRASEQQHAGWWIVGFVGLVVVGGWWLLRQNTGLSLLGVSHDPMRSQAIHDRETLLRACHVLADRMFGGTSQYWHHRQVFNAIGGSLPNMRGSVDQLAEIYESARYSPSGQFLSADALETARVLFSRIQRSAPAGL